MKLSIPDQASACGNGTGLRGALMIVLWVGVCLSLAILLAGLIMEQVGTPAERTLVPLKDIPAALTAGQSAAVITLGLFILLCTPVVSVVIVVIHSLLARDRYTGAVSFIVLLVIVVSFLMASRV